jgi:hypothetical protein
VIENYGHGDSTHLDQTALGAINTGFKLEDMLISPDDATILKRLAEKVVAIASSEAMADKRLHWQNINMLQETRPVVLCDPENGWNEIITEKQMECIGSLARRWEMNLRKEIFWGEEMGDDKPVEPYFVVPYTVAPEDWGLETVFHRSDMKDGSQSWDGAIKDYQADLPKLCIPDINIDWETTDRSLEIAKEVFESILEVRAKGVWWWSLGITLPAALLRGLNNMYMDFVACPNELKELLSFISKAHLHKLDYLEQKGLLSANNDGTYVGSGGYGFTTELQEPADGSIKCSNMWGFAESQETVGVSPQMYAEFVFPYEKPILERFGLNCYGCCEPIDPRWETVSQHHNLRRISCSPWANYEKMAEYLGNRYIFSMKPNPVVLATPTIDQDKIRSEIRKNLEITKGCIIELIMKDNHTIGKCPENVVHWCRIAKEEIERIY